MDQIVADLYRLYDRFGSFRNPVLLDSDVCQFYDELVDVFSTPLTEEETQSVIEQFPFQKQLTRMHGLLHLASEKKVARAFLAGERKSLFEDTWFDKHLPDVIAAQVQHWKTLGLRFRQDNPKIAMLGGGALPQSQIFFSDYTGIPVTCIDRDEEAAELANGILRKLEFNGLEVVLASGDEADYKEFDIVVMAEIEDKVKAVRRIRETSEAVICIRNPFRLSRIAREAITSRDVEQEGYQLMGKCCKANSMSLVFRPV